MALLDREILARAFEVGDRRNAPPGCNCTWRAGASRANNYLGLAEYPEVINATPAALDRWGYGLSSVRFMISAAHSRADLEFALEAFSEVKAESGL